MLNKIVQRKVEHFDFLAFTLYLMVATIPLGNNLNSRLIILFCIVGAFKNSLKDKGRQLKKNLAWVFSLLFFFFLFLSFIWDPHGIDALKALEKKASFLFLPIILASMPQLNKKVLKNAFLIFVLSILFACLYSIIKSATEYFTTRDYRVFFYHYLSKQLGLNAVYLSLYCVFSLCILIHYYFVKPDPFKYIFYPLAILLYFIFLAFLILLSSKMMLFIASIISVSSILYLAHRKGRLLLGILLLLLTIGVGGSIIYNVHYLRWRISVTSVKKYDGKKDNQNGFAIRQKLWEISTRLIKEKPVFGYGVMYANERLVEEYRKENFLIAAENKYNSHNTYLQTLLGAGILAGVPLIALLVISMIIAVRNKSYLFLAFLFVTVSLGITESLFEGQKGVVFFVLFLFLFVNHFAPHE